MTDNEKRAHDLAVAIAVEIGRQRLAAQTSDDESVIQIDYFTEYMSAYEAAKEAFDKRFPDGK